MTPSKYALIGAISLLMNLMIGCSSSDTADPSIASASDGTILATWNDELEVRKSDYESWLKWRELPDERSNLIEFASGLVLADAAQRRNDDETAPSARQVEDRVREVTLGDALADELQAPIEVTDAEIDAVLEAKPDAFVRPRRYALSNLFLSYSKPGQDKGAVLRRMQELRNRAVSGESFSGLAVTESESQSRFRGGKLGLVKLEELPADVGRVIESLRAGEISPIVDSAGGLAIYYCERIDEPLVHSPEEVRKKIRSALIEQKATRILSAFDQDLRIRNGLESTPDPQGRKLAALRAKEAEARGLHEREKVRVAIRWRTMQQLALREMQRRAQDRQPEPDIDILRKQFDAMQASGKGLIRHRVAGIAFGAATVDSAEQARSVQSQLEQGTLSFEEAARRFSTHESAQKGGDLGWFDRRRLATSDWSLMRAVPKMQVGALSGVLTSDTELWIYKVTDRQSGDEVAFDDVLPQMKRQYLQKQIRPLQRAVKREIAKQLVIH